jgi:hypothetical protein
MAVLLPLTFPASSFCEEPSSQNSSSQEPTVHRRILYNSDGTNIFGDKGSDMTVDTLRSFVDEVAGTQVDTFLLCQGGQTFLYPSDVGEYWGEAASPEDRARWSPRQRARVENLERFLHQGIDPFEVLVDRIHQTGMEALLTFRLNEAHTVPAHWPHVSQFWRDRPEWRIDPRDPEKFRGPRVMSMNFAVPEVRRRRLAEIREGLSNYKFDGLELDFQRWPYYFRHGEIEENVPTMTRFVRDVRRVVDEIAQQRGRPLVLSARVMPTIEQSRAVGLDPVQWNRQGLLDFLTVSRFLHNTEGELNIEGYRQAIPDIPIYGSIEVGMASGVYATPETYRREARRLWDEGVDGIYLFNFFCFRQAGKPIPFFLLNELGDPATIKDCQGPATLE